MRQLTIGNINYNKARVMVTGAYGMVGTALREMLPTTSNIIYLSRNKADLTNEQRVYEYIGFFRPDYIIHLAAKVGGVKANINYLADFFTENIKMNTYILDAAHKSGVKKVVSLLSTCVYPDKVIYPIDEKQIHNGPPHQSNYAYAYVKRMLDIQSQAYRDQFGDNFITAIPNNLYGEHDYFDLENSHVIPALIRKIYEAKQQGTDVILWGDGQALREFTYSKDIADILLFLLETYNERYPINIGNTEERKITFVTDYIADCLSFRGNVIWDITKPKGQHRKPSCNQKFMELLQFNKKNFVYTDIMTGLQDMCKWFVDNYPNVRGM